MTERVRGSNDVQDIDDMIRLYRERTSGQENNSSVNTDPDKVKEERKGQGDTLVSSANTKYTGPLHLYTNEHVPSFYTQDVNEFRIFFDRLGDSGVTFEYLFSNIEQYNKETGDDSITVSKVKSKLHHVDMFSTLSLKTIADITKMLNFELSFKFAEDIESKDLIEQMRKETIPAAEGKTGKYVGKLRVDTKEGVTYSRESLDFIDFLNYLGNEKDYTFELAYKLIDVYMDENGDVLTYNKFKNKLNQLVSMNTLSTSTVRMISEMLGYSVYFKYTPINRDVFEQQFDIDSIFSKP